MRTTHDTEEIMEVVSGYFKIKKDEVKTSRYSEQKKIAIYLMKERTGATSKQIGELFGVKNRVFKRYLSFMSKNLMEISLFKAKFY